MSPVHLRPLTKHLGGRLDYGQPVLLQPVLVSCGQERFDRLAICAGGYLVVMQTTRQILCRVYVGMGGVPAHHPANRLLGGTVLAGRMMTAMAFLRGIGTLD